MLIWTRCCVFAEGELNPYSIMQQKYTLVWGPQLLQGVFLNCPPNASYGLGMQHGICKIWLYPWIKAVKIAKVRRGRINNVL